MGTMNKLIQKDYAEQLGEIKQRIRFAQYEALRRSTKKNCHHWWQKLAGPILDNFCNQWLQKI
jgi:hypothetical protein